MLKPHAAQVLIPNIDLGRTFDLRYEDQEVHCEELAKMADFFGHNMIAHRHDRVYQIHLLSHGEVRLHLDDQFYQAKAPVFFLTPPSVTHAFIMSDDAQGYVLTVKQQLIWRLFKSDPTGVLEQCLQMPICIKLGKEYCASDKEVDQLFKYFSLLGEEFSAEAIGREMNLIALTRLGFVSMARLSSLAGPVPSRRLRQVDAQIFQNFNHLIEERFKQHWSLTEYANALNLTEARLNDVCRRVADISSKKLVHDRLLQEAKRQLLFSTVPVSTVAYDLGFKDVSYFSRFFRSNTSLAPGEWRDEIRERKV